MSREGPEIRLYRRTDQPLPLRLPMVGPTGERDNMDRLTQILGTLAPPGVWLVSIFHDDGCPAQGSGPIGRCTCAEVWVHVHVVSTERA
jgi:hypothetical protein